MLVGINDDVMAGLWKDTSEKGNAITFKVLPSVIQTFFHAMLKSLCETPPEIAGSQSANRCLLVSASEHTQSLIQNVS